MIADPRHSSETNEWYTPPELVEPFRELVGGIELDPASSSKANEIVCAERIYTAADDGLSQFWHCRTLWLNPPYGKIGNASSAAVWCDYLSLQWRLGHIREAACFLCHVPHFQHYAIQAFASLGVVIPSEGRYQFLDPDTLCPVTGVGSGQLLIGVGVDKERFAHTYRFFGTAFVAL